MRVRPPSPPRSWPRTLTAGASVTSSDAPADGTAPLAGGSPGAASVGWNPSRSTTTSGGHAATHQRCGEVCAYPAGSSELRCGILRAGRAAARVGRLGWVESHEPAGRGLWLGDEASELDRSQHTALQRDERQDREHDGAREEVTGLHGEEDGRDRRGERRWGDRRRRADPGEESAAPLGDLTNEARTELREPALELEALEHARRRLGCRHGRAAP